MSLSFVSSAVQIGTSGGGFEETAIENKETEAVNRRNAHKPLFEQLRSNQEEDQEKKDEIERQILRSTCALDDEDVAHLDSLERQRSDRERQIQERTKNELDSFRAAKALRQQAALAGDFEEDDSNSINNANTETTFMRSKNGDETLGPKDEASLVPTIPTTSLPVIKVKKRKRRKTHSIETITKHTIAEKNRNLEQTTDFKRELKDEDQTLSFSNETITSSRNETATLPVAAVNKYGGDGLGGLLSGYGSSSDEE